ncbi:MAG: aminopeptidase P family protein, partial [Candidatus Brocadiaceae bacterium]|nr:aminopeptidase P family protein [Candidatus Brocadiaceae bacterium]
RYMTNTLRITEKVLSKAIDSIQKSSIKNGLLYTKSGKAITAESIKKMISVELMKNGCTARHTIVSCHDQSCEPHNVGSGPLKANESIIFDIFPKDEETGYYADISRTVVKGKASPYLKNMYTAVESAQNLVFKFAKNGASGNNIHSKVVRHLKSLGYQTGKIKGKMRGFFHGTGHGIGLDIHETPRISRSKYTLMTGNVVTVEPGLYYPGIGGIRLEDTICITDDGCINLTKHPKILEV